MKKLFKILWITQTKREKNAFGSESTMRRFNPYNPITYVVIVIFALIGIIMYGLVGFWYIENVSVLKCRWKLVASHS
jgi:hypothetical protein